MHPARSEAYDADEILLETLRSVAWIRRTGLASVALTVLILVNWPSYGAGAALVVGWGVYVVAAVRSIRRLRRIAWCVRLSVREIRAYDYNRKGRSLPWPEIDRVELSDAGLHVFAIMDRRIDVPEHFPDFATVAHEIVRRAERHDVPVWIDGRPYSQLDVYALFPFLADDTSPGAPHGSATA